MKKMFCLAAVLVAAVVSFGSFAAFAAGVDDWNDQFGTLKQTDEGVSMFADAVYNTPLNPEYIKVTFQVKALTPLVDSWICIALTNSNAGGFAPTSAEPKGIFFMIRNANNLVSISGYNTGMSSRFFENKVMISSPLLNKDVTLKFVRDTAGNTWNLYCNGAKVNADSTIFSALTTADFTNADGKTHLGFAAYDASGATDHSTQRAWVVKEITDVNTDPAISSEDTTSVSSEVTDTSSESGYTDYDDYDNDGAKSTDGLDVGMIILLIVAGVVIVAGGGSLLYFLVLRKRK